MFDAMIKYAVFSGRARRQEFWGFMLRLFIVYFMSVMIDVLLGTYDEEAGIGIVSGIVVLLFLLPSISVSVRRLHDINRSGWWMLLTIIPFASFVLLVFYCLDGTKGENRFGPDPKANEKDTEV